MPLGDGVPMVVNSMTRRMRAAWPLALVPALLAAALAAPEQATPPTALGSAFALHGARSNPASRRVSISFTLAERGPATLELLDVAGRRLMSRDVGDLGPGPHVLTLDREVASLGTGVYLVRLRQGSRFAAGKLCVIR